MKNFYLQTTHSKRLSCQRKVNHIMIAQNLCYHSYLQNCHKKFFSISKQVFIHLFGICLFFCLFRFQTEAMKSLYIRHISVILQKNGNCKKYSSLLLFQSYKYQTNFHDKLALVFYLKTMSTYSWSSDSFTNVSSHLNQKSVRKFQFILIQRFFELINNQRSLASLELQVQF